MDEQGQRDMILDPWRRANVLKLMVGSGPNSEGTGPSSVSVSSLSLALCETRLWMALPSYLKRPTFQIWDLQP